MTTMLYHMRDNGIQYGLQTMCEGGGQANATIRAFLTNAIRSGGATALSGPAS